MITKTISNRVNSSLWGGHFVTGPLLFIVFILRFCCMASCYGKIYILYVYVYICRYIYIIREATVVLLH